MTLLATDHEHGHDHAHEHGHAHHLPLGTGEEGGTFWLEVGEAYTGLRTSLQLVAGLQLLGCGTGERADLRRAVLVRVRLLLAEVRDRLGTISPPSSELSYLAHLGECCGSLEEIAADQARQPGRGGDVADAADLTDLTDTARTQRMLESAADRLRRCQRYDLGLRFFGSGGCADIEHALSHLGPLGPLSSERPAHD